MCLKELSTVMFKCPFLVLFSRCVCLHRRNSISSENQTQHKTLIRTVSQQAPSQPALRRRPRLRQRRRPLGLRLQRLQHQAEASSTPATTRSTYTSSARDTANHTLRTCSTSSGNSFRHRPKQPPPRLPGRTGGRGGGGVRSTCVHRGSAPTLLDPIRPLREEGGVVVVERGQDLLALLLARLHLQRRLPFRQQTTTTTSTRHNQHPRKGSRSSVSGHKHPFGYGARDDSDRVV